MAEFRSKDNFGLDAELAAKEAAKYDPALEQMVVDFIEDVTGIKKDDDFLKWLKDGKVLCALINKVQPGTVAKVNDSTMPFKQMENIANFLKGCREKLGMRENDLFTTADIYDEKSIVNTLNGLVAFSRAASKSGFKGPSIAPKESEGSKKKEWEIGKGSDATFLSMGSAKTMDAPSMSGVRDIDFGNKAGGSGTAGSISKMSMGSAGTMDSSHVSQANDIDFGAKAGAGKLKN